MRSRACSPAWVSSFKCAQGSGKVGWAASEDAFINFADSVCEIGQSHLLQIALREAPAETVGKQAFEQPLSIFSPLAAPTRMSSAIFRRFKGTIGWLAKK